MSRAFGYFKLLTAFLGQTILFAFAWGFFGVGWVYGELTIPYNVVRLLSIWPRELTAVTTLIGTVLSLLTTSFFSLAFMEALRHRMHKPISLIGLEARIALAKSKILFTWHMRYTFTTLFLFGLTELMVSSWSTLLTPSLFATNTTVGGTELDLGSSYFESQLHQELLATGSATVSQGNSVKIIDTEGLLSGIASARLSFGVEGDLNFNGVLYNVTTGGVLPVAPGYLGTSRQAESGNTGLSFVGGLVPSNLSPPPTHGISSNYSIRQQGLTAQVTCTQVDTPSLVTTQTSSFPVSIFSGNATWLTAYSFKMGCNEGDPAQENYVTRSTDDGLAISSVGLVYSLVCPFPVNQSQLDWTRFNVTSGGGVSNKYAFLQLTTCEIVPQLTTTLVTYANNTLVTDVLDSTPLNSSNTDLALYLASVIEYQAQNSQGLTSNSFADALYSVAVTSNVALNNSGPMDPLLLSEIEQYWRGVIEFIGTYLRSGFSAAPITIPDVGLRSYSGVQTVTTMGWAKRSLIDAYTLVPVTLFLILTYAAIAYVLYDIARKGGYRYITFDPTNPLHLVMVSSTRKPDEKSNLEGERLGDFSDAGIQYNQQIEVQLVDVGNGERGSRKCFEKQESDMPNFETYRGDALSSLNGVSVAYSNCLIFFFYSG